MDWLTQPETWIGLFTLVAMEIVLGVDNIVFITILTSRLPEEQQPRARRLGLALAVLGRIALLFALTWVLHLTAPFTILGITTSGKGLILLAGGLFLIGKATTEIHAKLEGATKGYTVTPAIITFSSAIIQIMILDVIFALDSVITAVGMVRRIEIMVAAVIIAVIFMILLVEQVNTFIARHPTLKMLALAFLVLIGANLVAEGVGFEIPKGYTYFAMAFSLTVEMLNLKIRAGAKTSHEQNSV